MRYQRKIGKFNVVAVCANDLAAPAEALLDKIADIDRQEPIKDGTTIEFGWSFLTLRDLGDNMMIFEPYFDGNPFEDELPQVECTLRVLTQQIRLLNRLGVAGVTSHFQDKVVLEKGSLAAGRIYLERQKVRSPNDSGWYVGGVEKAENKITVDDLESVFVYQLLNSRPSVMAALALPFGFQVIFFGDDIEAVFDETGKDVWNA
jgi:hypothetical protein